MSDLSDEALMERVQRGETQQLGLLVARYERPLFAYALHLLGERGAAEDAFQETFLKVFRKRHTYRVGATFRPWLYQICLNHCRDIMRSRGRRPEVPLPEELPLADPAPGPVAQASDKMRSERIKEAVQDLPDKHREVFLLVHYQGLSYPEVAETLGIPVGTIKSRMFHSAKRLAERLRDWL